MDDDGEKISLKIAELSIAKFNQTIPQYLAVLQNHKCNIEKAGSLHLWDKVKREQINASRIVKQIKFMLVEIDKVRRRVRADDLKKFDEAIEAVKKRSYDSMAEYIAMQQALREQSLRDAQFEDEVASDNIPYGSNRQLAYVPQISSTFNKAEAELQEREECLRQMTQLQREMEDIQDLYQKVHVLVNEQGQSVTQVEQNVELTHIEVEAGVTALRRALAYKKAVYPLAGALLGTCIGGPIGLVVGLKAGGLAAIGGGLVGFASGKMIKNVDDVSANREVEQEEALGSDSATEAITGEPGEQALVAEQPIVSRT
ncbi:syntaxin-17 [Anopheles bellator]|uniref:syntaxin-17 n=1 Tax=Anopheles bellator TaxID=139047 RepID=UPI0026480031|nr:syntaxin-17 [Anopheles bellator]